MVKIFDNQKRANLSQGHIAKTKANATFVSGDIAPAEKVNVKVGPKKEETKVEAPTVKAEPVVTSAPVVEPVIETPVAAEPVATVQPEVKEEKKEEKQFNNNNNKQNNKR